MAYFTKRPLVGAFADASTFFLNDNGFINVSSVCPISVWRNDSIELRIPEDMVVTSYKTLFDLIYDAGYHKGNWEGTEKLKWNIKSKLEDLIFDEMKPN